MSIPMNSGEILAALDDIAAHAGKKDKEVLVAKYGADAEFKRALFAALDPFTTYGIERVPERTTYGAGYFTEGGDTWAILDRLAGRTLTGNEARQTIQDELNRLDEPSAQLFARILKKNLRAGFSENTVNKAFKGFIPTFPYMRCSLPKDTDLEKWEWAGGIVSQEKADGMFVNVDREPGMVRLTTRQGNEIPTEEFGPLLGFMLDGMDDNTQTHGELLVRSPDGVICDREIGNGMLNRVIRGGKLDLGHSLVLKVWDQIPLSAVASKGKYETPYIDRLRGLVAQLRRVGHAAAQLSLIETRIVRSLKEAYAHCKELLLQGKEGTVLKRLTAIWRDGTSKDQIKLKLEAVVDLEVTAIVQGREGTKNEGRPGSLTCRSTCGGLVTDVTVKNEAMRDAVEANPEDWIGRTIKVCANAIMDPSASSELHSLFLPRMVEPCYRLDKTTADSLDEIRRQFDSAIEAV